MTYSLTWLPGVLRAAGLKVVEEPGWEARGHGDMYAVRGVLLHHTAGCLHEKPENLCRALVHGRPDLPGPIANLGLEEDGTYYMIAAGRAYHAGPGDWLDLPHNGGNSHLIGIEAANTGLENDPWDVPQMDAYARGVAAILKHLGLGAIWAIAHKEYAKPPGRKTDPSFNMREFRAIVAEILKGNVS